MTKKRILVVDENRINAENVAILLKLAGYDVLALQKAELAFNLFSLLLFTKREFNVLVWANYGNGFLDMDLVRTERSLECHFAGKLVILDRTSSKKGQFEDADGMALICSPDMLLFSIERLVS